jgi:hypothetical protein
LKWTIGIPLESTWSLQQEDGRIGTEIQNILHPIKVGRDWPVMPIKRQFVQCLRRVTVGFQIAQLPSRVQRSEGSLRFAAADPGQISPRQSTSRMIRRE